MKKKIILISIMLIISVFVLVGCVPGDGTYTDAHTAGFFPEYGTAGLRR